MVRIPLLPVDSTCLKAVGYDHDRRTLRLAFRDGDREYDYYNVPSEVFDGLLAADSHGQFFLANIRDKFPCTRSMLLTRYTDAEIERMRQKRIRRQARLALLLDVMDTKEQEQG
jgi:hypothetical protein